MSMKKNALLALIGASLLLPSPGLAAELEKYRFLKVAPQEQKAVVKTPDGKLQLVGVGEAIAGAKVVEIAEGRVVLEEQGEQGSETVIFRLDGRHQRIERLHQRGEKAPKMVMPGILPPGAAAPGKY
jgi:hypothetical protein